MSIDEPWASPGDAPGRYYTATFVAAHDEDLAVSFLTIPRPARFQSDPESAADCLGITDLKVIELWGSELLPELLRDLMTQNTFTGEDDGRFFERLAFAAIIPFESSPLAAQALTSLIQGSGGALGAATGMLAGAGEPVLLLTVPLGVVLAGAAVGIARGLADGLEERSRNFVRSSRDARSGGSLHTRRPGIGGNTNRRVRAEPRSRIGMRLCGKRSTAGGGHAPCRGPRARHAAPGRAERHDADDVG